MNTFHSTKREVKPEDYKKKNDERKCFPILVSLEAVRGTAIQYIFFVMTSQRRNVVAPLVGARMSW